MEKQETHAPHHDENQKTHTPATMPCAWTGYGEPLPRLPINTGERTEPKSGGGFLGREKDKNKGEFLVGNRGTNRGNFGEGEGGRNRRKEAET